jgi:inorganic pyrophosphatase
MKYIATIEIPKNSDRRIHKGYEDHIKGQFVDFGPISEKITANGGRMPIAYGFINNTIGTDGLPDEIDVMVFSESDLKTEDTVEVIPFATMVRSDGDHKILAHDNTILYNSFNEIPAGMQKTLMEFNGFKLPIAEVKNKEETILYLNNNMLK